MEKSRATAEVVRTKQGRTPLPYAPVSGSPGVSFILALQRTFGNAAVAQLLSAAAQEKALPVERTAPYHPGAMSLAYWNILPEQRAEVDARTDERFRKLTGISEKLNWQDTHDRPAARTWLRLRDEEMSRIGGPVSTPVGPEPQPTYHIRIGSREYTVDAGGATARLNEVITIIGNHVSAEFEGHINFIVNIHEPVVADVSDLVGGVSVPPPGMWQAPIGELAQARAALGKQDPIAAAEHIRAAANAYGECHQRMITYLTGTQEGAKHTAIGLEIFSTIAITVSTTVLTAGAGSALGLTVTTGRGLLATAGLGAAVSGGTAFVKEGAVQGMELAEGLEQHFNFRRFLANVGASAVSGFVSSLLGGVLQQSFTKLMPMACSEEVFNALNEIRIMRGLEEWTRGSMQTYFARFGARILARLEAHLLAEAYRTTMQQWGKNEAMPASAADFWRLYMTNLWRVGGGRAIGQAMLAIGK